MAVESEAANGKLSGRFFYMPSFSRLFSHSCAIAQEKAAGCQDTQTGLLCLHSKSKMSDELQGNNCTLQPALEDGIAFFPIH